MLQSQQSADIFSRYPSITNMMRSLTTESRKNSEQVFLYNQCYKSPSIIEISNYIDTIPNKMSFFTLTINSETSYEIKCKILYDGPWFHHFAGNRHLKIFKLITNIDYADEVWIKISDYLEDSRIHTDYSLPDEIDHFKGLFLKIDDRDDDQLTGDEKYSMFVDLYSYYNIVNTRKSCIEIDKNFAKNATKYYFTETLKH